MKLKTLNRFNLSLALLIIVWGAWVRLSGSGAGCGDHWPLCNAEVIPTDPSLKTLTEFIHRLTSGLFGITVLWAMVKSIRQYGFKHKITTSQISIFVFTLIEAFIGAVLVKKGLVEKNQSSLRAFVIALHLINTYFLLYALAAGEFFLTNVKLTKPRRKLNLIAKASLVLFLLVGAAGAVTALGNTLFPESSLVNGVLNDFDPTSHFLIRLRIYHPISAIILSALLLIWGNTIKVIEGESLYSKILTPAVGVMVFFGALNWLLLSPSWGALTHLLLGDLLWICFVIACFYYRFQAIKKDKEAGL